MAVTAPLRIPVEIRRRGGARGAAPGERWFRLALGVSEVGLYFGRPLPEACDGPLSVTFVLPDDNEARIELEARAVSVETGDEAVPEARLAVRFLSPDEPSRARIARYVAVRVPATD
jgi:hypothetical protein